jgi:hypothetical protein
MGVLQNLELKTKQKKVSKCQGQINAQFWNNFLETSCIMCIEVFWKTIVQCCLKGKLIFCEFFSYKQTY